MTRVLVLGGAGFAGAAIAAEAVARGYDVAVSTRSDRGRAHISEKTEWLTGDDSDPATVAAWAQTRTLIVDAAAPYPLALHEPGTTHASRIEAARARMTGVLAAARSAGAALIHIGSFTTTTPAVTAADRAVRAAHPYFAVKEIMATACISAAASGAPVGVVAPTVLFGPGDLRADAQSFVGSVLSGGLAAAPPDVINAVDVRDVAAAVFRMADMAWYGQQVQISGHDIRAADLAGMIARIGGVAAPMTAPGLRMGAAALYATELAAGLVGLKTPPALPALLTLAGGPATVSPAQTALGIAPRPLETTIADEIAWRRR